MSGISNSSSSHTFLAAASSSSTTDTDQGRELTNFGTHCVTQELKGKEERNLVASSQNNGSGHTSFSTTDGKKVTRIPDRGNCIKDKIGTLRAIIKNTKTK